MEKETLKNIMHFLKIKEDKSSFKWKLLNNEPLTKDELTINGDLVLEDSNITFLPEGLMVYGTLDLYNCNRLTSLPEDLYVSMNLNLAKTSITSLPDGLQVGGRLNLAATKITSLPENLDVGGDLILNGCTELTSLPEDLEIHEDLSLYDCKKLSSLPKKIMVWGSLDLTRTAITSLPEGLEVGGYLLLDDTKIASLPKGFKVGKWVSIYNTPLEEYSDEDLIKMIYPGKIKQGIIRTGINRL